MALWATKGDGIPHKEIVEAMSGVSLSIGASPTTSIISRATRSRRRPLVLAEFFLAIAIRGARWSSGDR